MLTSVNLILGTIAFYVAVLFYTNRTARPKRGDIAVPAAGADLPRANERLCVLTWNIGYAALGENADFIIDKGTSLRALSRGQIAQAAKTIATWLAQHPADVICLQENAEAGFLTRQTPLRAVIDRALKGRCTVFWADMRSLWVPQALRLDHGMSLHSRAHIENCTTLDLPQDDTLHFGLIKKHYGGLIARIPITETGRDWVVINIHLSAFDIKGHAQRQQLQDLLQFAQRQYEQGHHVVIGGDLNMRLAATDFAHRSDVDDLLWARAFPHEALPKGWQLAVDPATPTARAMDAPFVRGETYTTILDGFLYAPNVVLEQVKTSDLGFASSDHQPVEAMFRAKVLSD